MSWFLVKSGSASSSGHLDRVVFKSAQVKFGSLIFLITDQAKFERVKQVGSAFDTLIVCQYSYIHPKLVVYFSNCIYLILSICSSRVVALHRVCFKPTFGSCYFKFLFVVGYYFSHVYLLEKKNSEDAILIFVQGASSP